jgi:hypothetical protein
MPPELTTLLMSTMNEAIDAAKSDLEGRLLAQYEEALLQFAESDPMLAYRLLGKDKLRAVVGRIGTYRSNVTEVIANKIPEEWAKTMLLDLMSTTYRRALDDIASTLDKDVLLLGKSCGFLEYRRCKRAVKNTTTRITEQFFAAIDPLIDEFVGMTLRAASSGHVSECALPN